MNCGETVFFLIEDITITTSILYNVDIKKSFFLTFSYIKV